MEFIVRQKNEALTQGLDHSREDSFLLSKTEVWRRFEQGVTLFHSVRAERMGGRWQRYNVASYVRPSRVLLKNPS